jgi:hypothetical protein
VDALGRLARVDAVLGWDFACSGCLPVGPANMIRFGGAFWPGRRWLLMCRWA